MVARIGGLRLGRVQARRPCAVLTPSEVPKWDNCSGLRTPVPRANWMFLPGAQFARPPRSSPSPRGIGLDGRNDRPVQFDDVKGRRASTASAAGRPSPTPSRANSEPGPRAAPRCPCRSALRRTEENGGFNSITTSVRGRPPGSPAGISTTGPRRDVARGGPRRSPARFHVQRQASNWCSAAAFGSGGARRDRSRLAWSCPVSAARRAQQVSRAAHLSGGRGKGPLPATTPTGAQIEHRRGRPMCTSLGPAQQSSNARQPSNSCLAAPAGSEHGFTKVFTDKPRKIHRNGLFAHSHRTKGGVPAIRHSLVTQTYGVLATVNGYPFGITRYSRTHMFCCQAKARRARRVRERASATLVAQPSFFEDPDDPGGGCRF